MWTAHKMCYVITKLLQECGQLTKCIALFNLLSFLKGKQTAYEVTLLPLCFPIPTPEPLTDFQETGYERYTYN
jgi:hypothetical protein